LRYHRKAADAHERDDRLDKAIAVWRKVSRQRPELIDVHAWLADLYARAGKLAQARRIYEELAAALLERGQGNLAKIVSARLAALT
jgi:tetratricopeptide (TPR) repeat protein